MIWRRKEGAGQDVAVTGELLRRARKRGTDQIPDHACRKVSIRYVPATGRFLHIAIIEDYVED